MNMAPGDAMGYNPKETDSLYKHIPFYIKLSASTKKAVGYFYHSTSECDFNMGRENATIGIDILHSEPMQGILIYSLLQDHLLKM